MLGTEKASLPEWLSQPIGIAIATGVPGGIGSVVMYTAHGPLMAGQLALFTLLVATMWACFIHIVLPSIAGVGPIFMKWSIRQAEGLLDNNDTPEDG